MVFGRKCYGIPPPRKVSVGLWTIELRKGETVVAR